MTILYWFLELLFPRRCVLCRKFLSRDELDLCHTCRADAPEFPYSAENDHSKQKLTLRFLDSATSVWYYEKNARSAILRYKFNRGFYLLPPFGRLLSMRILREYGEAFDVLTWVPISPLRKLRRGFDQSGLLCRAVGRELGVKPVRCLRKIRHNKPQSSLEHSGRRANVIGAYRAVHTDAFAGKRVLLIDDVVTTGATAEECAMTLLTAGAKSVKLATMAAAQKRQNITKEWTV